MCMTDTATNACLTPSRTHSSSRGTRLVLSRRRGCRSGFAGQKCVARRRRALPTRLPEASAVAADEYVRSVLALVVCDVPRARDLGLAHRAVGGHIRGVPGAHL